VTAQDPEPRAFTRTAREKLRHAREDLPRLGGLRLGRERAIALGLAIGVAAIVIKAGFNQALGGETGFILLTGAVALAAWVGGMPGGLAATLVAGVLNTAIFVAPEGGSLELTPIDLARTGLYVFAGSVVTALIASLRTSRDQLTESLSEVGAMAEDIERRDERLELVLASSGTGFWEWDIRDGALTWSEAIFEQHGLDPSAGPPTYERYIETIHPDDRPAFQAAIDEALATGASFSLEFRIVWSDGSEHWTHGVGRAFRDADGTPIRMVGTGTDITERRRLEAERDRLLDDERRAGAFREAFIDVISHELRTPITTILGLTQILARRGRAGDPQEEEVLIEDIAAESERLHRLVEDLLVLTRAERGEFAVEAEPLELRRVLTRVVERERRRLPGLDISIELPRDLPVVAGEEIYVEQIVRNMLSNAAKYTPIGTQVHLRADHEDDEVAIRVLDDGPGIDPAAAERAFELFYRDPDTSRMVAGSGIGLFVCSSLVRAMGGRIWARPRPEGGSEFGFTLQVLLDDESRDTPPVLAGATERAT
jgi:PAS domain S-box-containing protein